MTTSPPTSPGPGREPRFTAVHVLAVVTALLGVLMIVRSVASGGGIGSYGVLVGVLFLAAGVMRLRLLRAKAQSR